MFDLAALGTFVAVVLGLFLIPGPAVLLVLTRTVQGGRKAGILTGLGVASGDFVHTLCAAVGLSALFFLAFLPQFVHPERGSSFVQFAVLGLIFVGLSAAYTTLIALTIRPLGLLVKRLSWLARWQGKIIGTIFISLGLKVATQHR